MASTPAPRPVRSDPTRSEGQRMRSLARRAVAHRDSMRALPLDTTALEAELHALQVNA